MISNIYFDRLLFFLFLVLVITGGIFVYSAVSVDIFYKSNPYKIIIKELIILFAGIIAFIIGYITSMDFLKRFGYIITALAVFLLILVLVVDFALGKKIKRWLSLGFFRFQPSEFAKFAIIVFIATYLHKKRKDFKTKDWQKVLGLYSVIAIISFLVLIEPHQGGALFLFTLGFLIISSSYLPFRYTFLPFILSIPVFGLAIFLSDYARSRIETFIDPFHASSKQVLQALGAFAKGGFLGEGLGAGIQKLKFLPEIHTDYIFALIGEELGFIGAVSIVVIFMLILWRGIYISLSRHDMFTQTVGVGITFYITLQALFHIMVNVGAFPPTGFTLPFISYGGSSFLITMYCAGLLLRVSKEPVKSPFVED